MIQVAHLHGLSYSEVAAATSVAGFGSPSTRRSARQSSAFFRARVMAGVVGSRKARRFLVPVCQPATSATLSIGSESVAVSSAQGDRP